VLPELFATGYTFINKEEAFALAEPVGGETTEFLITVAKNINGTIVGGYIERENGAIYNAALIVDRNGVIGSYRKIHLFNKEKHWFSPGNRPFKVYQLDKARIGVMICFDWMFPEAARTLALQKADIIAHPANLVLPYCQQAMTTRCLENRVFAVTANRIGTEKRGEDHFAFTGASQITGTKGEILSSASTIDIAIHVVEIDVSKAQNKLITDFNDVLTDRRPDFYYT
jgi:predicted amidohydrolase